MTKVRTIWQLNTIAIAIANKRCKINENILIYGFPITKFQTFNTSPLCVTPMRPGHSCKGSYLFILVEFLKVMLSVFGMRGIADFIIGFHIVR